jgi:hypothetical protein
MPRKNPLQAWQVTSTVGLILMMVAPGISRGDGYIVPRKEAADMEVRATAQRALLWLRDGTWEVHIQPVFAREAGRAAWVVPFTTRPTIREGNAALLEQLEIITSPVFIASCTQHVELNGGCLSAGSFTDGGPGAPRGPPSAARDLLSMAHEDRKSGAQLKTGWIDRELAHESRC